LVQEEKINLSESSLLPDLILSILKGKRGVGGNGVSSTGLEDKSFGIKFCGVLQ